MSWSMGFVVVRDCRPLDVLGRIKGAHLMGESAAADNVFTSELPSGAHLSLTRTVLPRLQLPRWTLAR